MKWFLLKNPSKEANVTAHVTVEPSEELDFLGVPGATIVQNNRVMTCLAPDIATYPEAENHRTECFDLVEDGLYAVEINKLIQPFAFSPADLLECFNGTHESAVKFNACTIPKPVISCTGAKPNASFSPDVGTWHVELNDTLYTNSSGDTITNFIQQTPDLVKEISVSGEDKVVIANIRTTTTQRIRFVPADNNSTGLLPNIDVNPTASVYADQSVIACLAPARRPISCDGAKALFSFKNGYSGNKIEVSVNNGPWEPINGTSAISVSVIPGQVADEIVVSLLEKSATHIRLRTEHNVAFYVYPADGIDQISSNAAYTIYNREGFMVDPLDTQNQTHTGDVIDTSAQGGDKAVYFAEAEFCMEPEVFTVIAKAVDAAGSTTFRNNLQIAGLPSGVKIHWGDGSSVTTVSGIIATKRYTVDGFYNVTFDFPNENIFSTLSIMGCVDEVTNWDDLKVQRVTLTSGSIRKVPNQLPATVDSMEMMFYDTPNFNQDISNWDVRNITNMRAAFYLCTSFNQDLSGWNVNAVTNYENFDAAASSWVLPRPNFR